MIPLIYYKIIYIYIKIYTPILVHRDRDRGRDWEDKRGTLTLNYIVFT